MAPKIYYNENDPYCVEWLKNLIAAKLIPDGDVDARSILDVTPNDLKSYRQCHFFAGIGGWAYALALADFPIDREVWTGSCPCQPFSLAGSRRGFADDRDLWPFWNYLIAQRRPATIFGEQVASATEWLARTRSDLEEMGYAVGAMPIEAASDGAAQLRDRFWFVANHDGQCKGDERLQRGGQFSGPGGIEKNNRGGVARQSSVAERKSQHEIGAVARQESWSNGSGLGTGLGNSVLASERSERLEGRESFFIDDGAQLPAAERNGVRDVEHVAGNGWGEGWTEHEFRSRGFTAAVASIGGLQFVECPDGKWRRLPPPRVRWLGNAVPARVAKLRAYGNAIVPQVAAQFVKVYLEIPK